MKSRTITKVWNDQHHTSWRRWVPSLAASWGYNKCNRDEYPPFAFMASDGANYVQWLRFLPQSQNSGAGQLWNQNICDKVESQTKAEGGPINGKTCTEIKSILYTVGAFSMRFANIPNDELSSNPCLPEITNDPGWALLTNDKWYGANILAGHDSATYAYPPEFALTGGLSYPRHSPGKRRQLDDQEILELLAERPEGYYAPTEKLEFDPEKIVVDIGNSSRHISHEELWDAYGLVKCQSENCQKEREAAGLVLEQEEVERLARTTEHFTVSTRAAAGSVVSGSVPTTTSNSVPSTTLGSFQTMAKVRL